MALDFAVNYVAVVGATVAVMVFGFIFFLPQVFGARWMALIGRPNEPMRPGPEFVISILRIRQCLGARCPGAVARRVDPR